MSENVLDFRKIATEIILYIVMVLIAIVMIIPFIYMVSIAFKTPEEMLVYPPKLFPQHFYLENFRKVWEEFDLSRYFFNTVIVSVSKTILTVLTAVLAAYPFAKIDFPLRKVLFFLILATLMIPYHITVIPLFVLIRKIPFAGGNNIFGAGGTGWLNTLWSLIIPGYVSSFGIFLLTQFISVLPDELFDAARIDGCSEFVIFKNIVLPLVKPALTTLSVISFQGTWNDFLWPLLVAQKPSVWTLQVALSQLNTQFSGSEWAQLMAGTTISIIPIMVLFIFAQRYFVQGIALTGIK